MLYDVYDRLAADDAHVSVVPLDRWLIDQELDRSAEVRPDGIHPTPEAATDISERYLGEQLVRLALAEALPS